MDNKQQRIEWLQKQEKKYENLLKKKFNVDDLMSIRMTPREDRLLKKDALLQSYEKNPKRAFKRSGELEILVTITRRIVVDHYPEDCC